MMNDKIDRKIDRLIQYGMEAGLLPDSEQMYAVNLILDLLRLNQYDEMYAIDDRVSHLMNRGHYGKCLDHVLGDLLEYAVLHGVIKDTQTDRDIFDTKLMNCLTARPEDVILQFRRNYEISPLRATEYFYRFSQNTNYIRRNRLEKDIRWKVQTKYGVLEILISLSKPEKDPKAIARTAGQPSRDYPRCALCCENVGFAGDACHSPRQNHRIIPLNLYGEACSFQYSPYGYFNEHCIVINNQHVPMVINDSVFYKLLDFVDLFPHYFIGSNSDLPYVGGSILSHEHFQGGCCELPVMAAKAQESICLKECEDTRCEILCWPVSTLRLTGRSHQGIGEASALILKVWKEYQDEESGIFSHTDGEYHNTITPILRKLHGNYEMYLMLRNNRTSRDRPYGIFHTRPELFHIKKEGIGVIDAPGLAVLPPRLAREMDLLYESVVSGKDLNENPDTAKHGKWMKEVLAKHTDWDQDNLKGILREEIGIAFQTMLEDAGVFKMDGPGQRAFKRFLKEIQSRKSKT